MLIKTLRLSLVVLFSFSGSPVLAAELTILDILKEVETEGTVQEPCEACAKLHHNGTPDPIADLIIKLGIEPEAENAPTRQCPVLKGISSFYYEDAHVAWHNATFNPRGMTLAHRTLPFGTKLRLTNPETHKSVIATVNDRGPYIEGRDFDVSLGVAELLAFVPRGKAYENVHKGRGTAYLVAEILNCDKVAKRKSKTQQASR